jgi:hypothetical protein
MTRLMVRLRRAITGRLLQGRSLCLDAAGRARGALARDRAVPPETGGFLDYGADWPPSPSTAPPRHPLLRRCLAIVVVYAVIWVLGSALLEVRLHQLRAVHGHEVTTYTTIDR